MKQILLTLLSVLLFCCTDPTNARVDRARGQRSKVVKQRKRQKPHTMTFTGENSAETTVMDLFLLNDTLKSGAVCLDGTPAGFYFSPAKNPRNSNDWQFYLQGGGWCYDERDCWSRSNNFLGSSKFWQKNGTLGGLFSSDCDTNPDFCNYNRVWLGYCDGNSFASNRAEPLMVKGPDGKVKPLYFRVSRWLLSLIVHDALPHLLTSQPQGRQILDAVFKALEQNFGFSSAENVMLSGCSAGGLAVFLHTDYIGALTRAAAPDLKRFKAVPLSGYFLKHPSVTGERVYEKEIKSIFELSNATGGLPQACVRAQRSGNEYLCNFAQFAYAYTREHSFPINSALDSWQTQCILAAALPEGFPEQIGTENGNCSSTYNSTWSACANDPEKCTSPQMRTMNDYIKSFEADFKSRSAPASSKKGNGAFLHSCHTHCEAQSDAFTKITIGGTSMRDAVGMWWNADGEPASKHTYLPCYYHLDASTHHQCNPSC